jgi:hypothetical protein
LDMKIPAQRGFIKNEKWLQHTNTHLFNLSKLTAFLANMRFLLVRPVFQPFVHWSPRIVVGMFVCSAK